MKPRSKANLPLRLSSKFLPALILIFALCGTAVAGDLFTIHENLHAGQKLTYAVTSDYKVKSTSTTGGVPTVTDTIDNHSWKVTLTIQEAKDGSAVRSVADVDGGSTDTSGNSADNPAKTPCPYAGKTIALIHHSDDTLTNDFSGNASYGDVNLMNNFITPDAEWYPDKPVAIGDTWDNTDKVAKYASLGPKDKLACTSQLDWVRTINGKQLAQISSSGAAIYHEDGHVEEEIEMAITQLVDLSSGVIIKCEQKTTSTYKTPIAQATQVTGGTELIFRAEVVQDSAATRP